MRKPTDDPTARQAAEATIACHLERSLLDADDLTKVTPALLRDTAGRVLATFPYAEQETVTRDVQGERVTLRRVVLTGGWNVVHE